MFDVYTPTKPKLFTPADRDPASRLIRVCRWMLWAAMAVSVGLVVVDGTSRTKNPFALDGWACYFAFSTGNFALYLVERHRKKKKEAEIS
jgi:hypothetical protein